MDIGNISAASLQSVGQEQVDPAVENLKLKESIEKTQQAGRIPEKKHPSLREVVESSNKRSTEVVDLLKEVSEVNAHIQIMQSSLLLSVDSASGRNVVTVTDKTTGDLIRKIPSEEVLAMSARIRQYMASMQQQIQAGKQSDLKGMLYEGKG